MPRARIMTFGYDADVVRAIDVASTNTLRDHGKGLATELGRMRLLGGTENRPLIFVAHSLGGLVCEQALLISRGAAESWLNALLPCTSGILFLGTPHAGANLADWARILTNLSRIVRPTNKSLTDVLRPGSEMLANLQQEFHVLLDARQSRGEPVPRIYCFFEELPYAHGIGHIVPSHSAILTRYGNQGIHANHVDMTKFKDRGDKGYLDVSGQLRIWAMEIERSASSVEARTSAGGESLPNPGIWPAQGGSSGQGSRRLYLGSVQSTGGYIIQGDLHSAQNINISSGGTLR